MRAASHSVNGEIYQARQFITSGIVTHTYKCCFEIHKYEFTFFMYSTSEANFNGMYLIV